MNTPAVGDNNPWSMGNAQADGTAGALTLDRRRSTPRTAASWRSNSVSGSCGGNGDYVPVN
jgi:hypothetical protein